MPRGTHARGGRIAASDTNRIGNVDQAKAAFIEGLAKGLTVDAALSAIGRSSQTTYRNWRRDDPTFAQRCDNVIARRRGGTLPNSKQLPGFEQFSSEYLEEPLFWHQQQWVDVLEGREPRDLHPAQIYEPGDPQYLLINVPPGHAKSTTITQNLVTHRIVENPNLRVIIVSKARDLAGDFLFAIKERLSGSRYSELQADFGPPEGWQKTAKEWAQFSITLGEKDDGQKDPTVQALGIGGQIYGKRADLIILDDCIDTTNSNEADKQLRWLQMMVVSRLSAWGTLLVIGTRVGSGDLYKRLREDFAGQWTYFASPAILEPSEDPAEERALWPRSTVPCGCRQCVKNGRTEPDADGLYPKWDGTHLRRVRGFLSPNTWALAYMQTDVSEDQIFPEAAVKAALNRQRIAGLLDPKNPGARPEGMNGLYVICSMDPALSGGTAAVALALDTKTGKRWVLEVFNKSNMTPATIHQLIRAWTQKYQPREWRVEKNAMQGMLTQDEELRQFLNARGCRLVEHFTDKGKWDDDFGVAGMAPLFLAGLDSEGKPTGRPLIDLPHNRVTGGSAANAVDQLVTQLVSWAPLEPGKRARPGTTDIVMALWFAEIRCRELVNGRDQQAGFAKNPYLTRGGRGRQMIVDLDALILEQEVNEVA